MTRYERVRFEADGRRRSVILRLSEEPPAGFLAGIEVDRFGEEVAPRGIDERLHLIQREAVLSRTPLRMNNHYAELEEAPPEVEDQDAARTCRDAFGGEALT